MITSINQFLSIPEKHEAICYKRDPQVSAEPGMISFAGGLPAPETFPVNDLKEIVAEILEKDGPDSLQYGTTEGDPLLRKMLSKDITGRIENRYRNLIITSASQQALDLIAKYFSIPAIMFYAVFPPILAD